MKVTAYRMSLHEMEVEIDLPERWTVNYLPVRDVPPLGPDGLREAFARPIGTGRIVDLARGKRKAVVIVEDITRPCPAEVVVPLVLEELHEAGLAADDIKIVMAVGGHRPMAAREFRAKLGDWVVEHYEVVNPNPYENMVHIGTTEFGTPVEVDLAVAEADFKVSVGALLPHNVAGFTGGGKLLLPGVSSMRTIMAHHYADPIKAGQGGFGQVECLFRHEIEAAARLAGLDVIVEAVLTKDLRVAGLFVGDLVEAHRAGVAVAEQVCTVWGPSEVDVVITTGFPRDIELLQAMAAFSPGTGARSVRPDGAIMLMAAAPEGIGYHTLRDRFRREAKPSVPLAKHSLLYCPRLTSWEAARYAPEGTVLYAEAQAAVADLAERFPNATANVFPQGAMVVYRPQ